MSIQKDITFDPQGLKFQFVAREVWVRPCLQGNNILFRVSPALPVAINGKVPITVGNFLKQEDENYLIVAQEH